MSADGNEPELELVEPPLDEDPSEEDIVAALVDQIGDLEWQLNLYDPDEPAGFDIAIGAAAELTLIYSHLGDIPIRDRMLARLVQLVSAHRTSARTRLISKVYGSLAAHPGQTPAA